MIKKAIKKIINIYFFFLSVIIINPRNQSPQHKPIYVPPSQRESQDDKNSQNNTSQNSSNENNQLNNLMAWANKNPEISIMIGLGGIKGIDELKNWLTKSNITPQQMSQIRQRLAEIAQEQNINIKYNVEKKEYEGTQDELNKFKELLKTDYGVQHGVQGISEQNELKSVKIEKENLDIEAINEKHKKKIQEIVKNETTTKEQLEKHKKELLEKTKENEQLKQENTKLGEIKKIVLQNQNDQKNDLTVEQIQQTLQSQHNKELEEKNNQIREKQEALENLQKDHDQKIQKNQQLQEQLQEKDNQLQQKQEDENAKNAQRIKNNPDFYSKYLKDITQQAYNKRKNTVWKSQFSWNNEDISAIVENLKQGYTKYNETVPDTHKIDLRSIKIDNKKGNANYNPTNEQFYVKTNDGKFIFPNVSHEPIEAPKVGNFIVNDKGIGVMNTDDKLEVIKKYRVEDQYFNKKYTLNKQLEHQEFKNNFSEDFATFSIK